MCPCHFIRIPSVCLKYRSNSTMNNITKSLNIVSILEKKNPLQLQMLKIKTTKPKLCNKLAGEKKLLSSFPANDHVTISERHREWPESQGSTSGTVTWHHQNTTTESLCEPCELRSQMWKPHHYTQLFLVRIFTKRTSCTPTCSSGQRGMGVGGTLESITSAFFEPETHKGHMVRLLP